MEHDVLLQMTDICKEFPGVKALDNVNLQVEEAPTGSHLELSGHERAGHQ